MKRFLTLLQNEAFSLVRAQRKPPVGVPSGSDAVGTLTIVDGRTEPP